VPVKTAFLKGWLPCLVLRRFTGLFFHLHSLSRQNAWSINARSRFSCGNAPIWSCCSTTSHSYRIPQQRRKCSSIPTRYASGDNAGPGGILCWKTKLDGGASPFFPPRDEAIVQAVACEAVYRNQLPLSRLALAELTTQARVALGQPISRNTIRRILETAAIKPWRYEYWIFPRDPQFAEKAGVIVDLYAGLWQGQPLGPRDCLLSADEKTSIQARIRCHPSLAPGPGRLRRIEHEYKRGGALQYLAAWDVQRGYVIGRCEPSTGIEPFGRLVAQVMAQEPYRSAERVFWVVDNGSSHRGQAAVKRLSQSYANMILVHTPVHASWLNQVEIYFSIIQRKVLTPNDFASLEEVEQRLRLYEALTNQQPRPFNWKFDRAQLEEFLQRLEAKRAVQSQAAEGQMSQNHVATLAA
jgi:DDE superfamily endonuclease